LSYYNLGKALEQGTLCIPRKSVLPGTTNVIVEDEAFSLTTKVSDETVPGKTMRQ
jgi:hypothetical protein